MTGKFADQAAVHLIKLSRDIMLIYIALDLTPKMRHKSKTYFHSSGGHYSENSIDGGDRISR